MLANELMNRYNLNQAEAAKLLGISQPAISLYQKKLRGTAIHVENDPDITTLVAKHADFLVKGASTHKEIILSFCGICKTIRAKGFLCEIHKAFDPTIEIEKCGFCQTSNPHL
jgi:predicted transcriptional regulator